MLRKKKTFKPKKKQEYVIDNDYSEEYSPEYRNYLLYNVLETSFKNRLQLASIQVLLLVIIILLSLKFFGWITAVVLGIVFGLVIVHIIAVGITPSVPAEDDDYSEKYEGEDVMK